LLAGDVGGGIGPVADADLPVGVLQVPLDGVHADHQRRGDLVVGVAGRQQLQDLGFPAGQPVRSATATALERDGRRGVLPDEALGLGQQSWQDAR